MSDSSFQEVRLEVSCRPLRRLQVRDQSFRVLSNANPHIPGLDAFIKSLLRLLWLSPKHFYTTSHKLVISQLFTLCFILSLENNTIHDPSNALTSCIKLDIASRYFESLNIICLTVLIMKISKISTLQVKPLGQARRKYHFSDTSYHRVGCPAYTANLSPHTVNSRKSYYFRKFPEKRPFLPRILKSIETGCEMRGPKSYVRCRVYKRSIPSKNTNAKCQPHRPATDLKEERRPFSVGIIAPFPRQDPMRFCSRSQLPESATPISISFWLSLLRWTVW